MKKGQLVAGWIISLVVLGIGLYSFWYFLITPSWVAHTIMRDMRAGVLNDELHILADDRICFDVVDDVDAAGGGQIPRSHAIKKVFAIPQLIVSAELIKRKVWKTDNGYRRGDYYYQIHTGDGLRKMHIAFKEVGPFVWKMIFAIAE